MDYKYHCQHQAESFSRSVLSVPENYPLKKGLPEDFRVHFARLCDLARKIYMDMAEQPEAYGLMLVDIQSKDHSLARDGYRTIHRFADLLNALFLNGEIKAHCLQVDAARFKTAIAKKPAVPKYGLVLSKLRDFGFSVSGFDGTSITPITSNEKNAVSFTVKYPDYPDIIDTIKIYCECWKELDQFRRDKKSPHSGLIKHSAQEYHHHFYRFDYKITADMTQIPMLTWVSEDADYNGFSPSLKEFSIAFFNASLKYKGLKFDGEYFLKSKRIARIMYKDFGALGKPDFVLSLKLSEPDRYMDAIRAMPDSIREPFTKDCCRHHDFQGATEKHCKFRLHWTYDNTAHMGCAYQCFVFNDFDSKLVDAYWRLLELEYGLKKETQNDRVT